MDYDLAIIGAGPSGIACALRAADLGLSVLLCDAAPAAFDRADPLDKVCGEGVMPAGVRTLRELGVELGGSRAFDGVRYYLGGRESLTLDFDAPGEALWRPDLQRALLDALDRRPAVRRLAAKVEAAPLPGGGYRVQSAAESARARALVAADGGSAAAAPWLRPGGRPAPAARRHAVGARARVAESGTLDRVEVHFGSGYEIYLTPLPRHAVNVVVLAEDGRGASARELLEHGLAAHPAARRRLGAELTRAESRPLSVPWPRIASDGDSFITGDAGGGVDPIIGAGISIAVRTGVAAAAGAHRRACGASAAEVAADFDRVHRGERRNRARLARLLHATARHDALARGTAAVLRVLPGLGARLGRIASGGAPTATLGAQGGAQ